MSSVTQRLVFDPSDENSRLASANIGAYVRSGQSGALITHQSDVKDSVGTFDFVDADVNTSTDEISETGHGFNTGDVIQLTSTGTLPDGLSLATDYYVIRVDADTIKLASSALNAENGSAVDITAATGGGTHTLTGQAVDIRALDVWVRNASIEVSATDLDIRDLVYTQDSIEAYQGGSWTVSVDSLPADVDIRDLVYTQDSVTSYQGGTWDVSVNSLPADIDIRDLVHTQDSVRLGDGTSYFTSTTIGSDIGLDVNMINSDLADSGIENTATAVSTSAVNLVSSALSGRKWLWLANEGNKSTYWGKSGVTTANGFPLHPGMQHVARVGASVAPQIIGGVGASSEDIRVMELA